MFINELTVNGAINSNNNLRKVFLFSKTQRVRVLWCIQIHGKYFRSRTLKDDLGVLSFLSLNVPSLAEGPCSAMYKEYVLYYFYINNFLGFFC